MKFHIYSEALEEEIIKTRYIPRRIKKNERLKVFHKYWMPEFGGTVKVNEIEYYNGTAYYFLRFAKNMMANITHPVEQENVYELLHNYDEIEKDNIINSSKSYSGAEIKFWFIVNKIDFSNPLYEGFLSFVNDKSLNVVSDNKFYFVKYNPNSRQKFKVIVDRSKLPA